MGWWCCGREDRQPDELQKSMRIIVKGNRKICDLRSFRARSKRRAGNRNIRRKAAVAALILNTAD